MMNAKILCTLVFLMLSTCTADEIPLVQDTKERAPLVAVLDTKILRNQLRDDFMKEINAAKQQLASMSSELQKLKESSKKEATDIAALTQKVALTACQSTQETYPPKAVVKYTAVKTHTGIKQKDVDSFKSTGKFICDSPGLYLVSASVVTGQTPYASFRLNKDKQTLAWPYISSDSTVNSGSAVVAVDLERGDSIWIEALGENIDLYIDDNGSCLTVVKIK